MPGVSLNNVVKAYGSTVIIPDLSLDIPESEFVVIVGPSGCGKSTTLRMIAGLEETSSGNIHIGEREVTRLDAADRGVAMVFQQHGDCVPQKVDAVNFPRRRFSLQRKQALASGDVQRVGHERAFCGSVLGELEVHWTRRP